MFEPFPEPVGRFPGDPWSFLVLSRRQAAKYEADVPHVVVSITAPAKPGHAELADAPTRRGVLRMSFDDFDDSARQFSMQDLTGGRPPQYFGETEGIAIRDFIGAHRDDVSLIVCHCEAGMSRSPAVAAALSRWLNGNDEVANAISHWLAFDRMELDEHLVIWNSLVHDTLRAVLDESTG